MNQEMKDGRDVNYMPVTSINSGRGFDVLPDLYQHTLQIVNIVFYGNPDATTDFVLIDAGMPKSAQAIISMAEKRFGPASKPKAIILTHGHFDHVGAVMDLIEHWNVPVYAHPLELPYVTGQQNYPRPDPTVNGGLIAKMSGFFPHAAIQLGRHVQPLPTNGIVPHMAGFRWIHTPGHTPGHISLFRDQDRALIAGDAFVTVKQESLFNVLLQKKEIHGPPRYFTTDWLAAKESVKKLASLNPSIATTGHGVPMKNEELTSCLHDLANRFEQLALPKQGKYLN